jgi:hypothetical protein
MTQPEGFLAFSSPVSEGLIRENAFENNDRDREPSGIPLSPPNLLPLLDYRRIPVANSPESGKRILCHSLNCDACPVESGSSTVGIAAI